MSDGDRRRDGGFDLGTQTAMAIEAQLASLSAGELKATVRDALEQYGETDIDDDLVAALCILSAGFLRTGPLVVLFPDEARDGVVSGFVRAFMLAPASEEPYGQVRQLLADAFHQRELAAPPGKSLEVLQRTTAGLMAAKGLPAAGAAPLAMADWMTSIYLAGADAW